MQPSKLLDWSGRTAVVCGSGPSLDWADLAHAVWAKEGLKIMAVNSSCFVADWIDVCYACDFLWWKTNIQKVKKEPFARNNPTALWTQDRAAAERFGINWVRGTHREGLGTSTLNTGGNSGYGAVNLAYLFGARRILLLGFDMKEGPNGEKHWHEDHPRPLVQKQLFGEWIHKFKKLAEDLKVNGCEVINCTPGSALPWFPMSTINKELP